VERGLELSITSFLLLMAVNSFPGIAEALAAEPNRQENRRLADHLAELCRSCTANFSWSSWP